MLDKLGSGAAYSILAGLTVVVTVVRVMPLILLFRYSIRWDGVHWRWLADTNIETDIRTTDIRIGDITFTTMGTDSVHVSSRDSTFTNMD